MGASRAVRLTERDHQILEHVHLYRISTVEVLHRLFWEPEVSRNAVSQVLARLGRHLHDAPLIGPHRYYLLTPEAARECGEEEDFARPLGPMSLAHHYAMLEFCCLAGAPREVVAAHEFVANFPDYCGRGLARHRYFLTQTTPRRLGWLEVDCGNHPQTRVRKCWKQFTRRYDFPGLKFRELADRGQFFVALVTTSEGKRRSLERARGKLARFPLEIHVSDTLRPCSGGPRW